MINKVVVPVWNCKNATYIASALLPIFFTYWQLLIVNRSLLVDFIKLVLFTWDADQVTMAFSYLLIWSMEHVKQDDWLARWHEERNFLLPNDAIFSSTASSFTCPLKLAWRNTLGCLNNAKAKHHYAYERNFLRNDLSTTALGILKGSLHTHNLCALKLSEIRIGSKLK